MIFLRRNKNALNKKGFSEADYSVLDYDQLLKVNGAKGSSGGSGQSGPSGSSNSSGQSSSSSSNPHQTPTNSNDYHCDIIAYNEAVDNGAQNPGNWDGNTQSVNQIYNDNYSGQGSTNSVPNNTSGYVFYDWDCNGSQDHMEYYSAGNDSTYTVHVTDGISDPVPIQYDSSSDNNGHAATGNATFVPIN